MLFSIAPSEMNMSCSLSVAAVVVESINSTLLSLCNLLRTKLEVLKTYEEFSFLFSIFQLNHLEIKQVTVLYVDHVSSVLLKTKITVQALCTLLHSTDP